VKRIICSSILVSLSIILLCTACNKIDTTDLGNELIPAVDNVNTFQTILDITSENVLFDDTTRKYAGDYGVGVIEDDPEFGKTRGALYFGTAPTSFGTHPFIKQDSVVIDSVVLSLAFSSLYGDSNSIQEFEVREIDQSAEFSVDSAYMLGHPDFPVVPQLLGSKQVNFTTLNDTIQYVEAKDTVNSSRELRIKLDTNFGRRFVNYTVDNAYKNDTVFKTVFKGFEVKVNDASQQKNALAYFNIADTKSRLTFYLRVVNNGKTDTVAPYFTHLSGRDPQANLIRRTPAHGYLTAITNANPNADKIYMQTTPGSYAKLTIQGLDTFAQTNRVIHLADLTVNRVEGLQDNIYTAPTLLFLDAINAARDSAFTIRTDFIPSSTAPGYDVSTIGGVLRNNNSYSFNISRYLQGIVTRKEPIQTLRIYAPYTTSPFYMPKNGIPTEKVSLTVNTPAAAGRIILAGGAFPDETKKLRLRIIYSKIN
jgi:hypothetical protein